MVKNFVDWFYCWSCERNVKASIVVDIDEVRDHSRTVDVIVSAICTECGAELVSRGANMEMN